MCGVEGFSQVAIRNLKLRIRFFAGVLAQLVERLNGIEEVTGSNPVGSSLRSRRRAKTAAP